MFRSKLVRALGPARSAAADQQLGVDTAMQSNTAAPVTTVEPPRAGAGTLIVDPHIIDSFVGNIDPPHQMLSPRGAECNKDRAVRDTYLISLYHL